MFIKSDQKYILTKQERKVKTYQFNNSWFSEFMIHLILIYSILY